jgi:predicted secreted protein
MSGTTAYKGRLSTLQISTNGGSTFTTIAGIRTKSVAINNNPVDITNDGSNGFQELLADGGTQQVDISFSGVTVDDTPLEAVMAQGHDRTKVYYKFNYGNAGVILGQFVISSITYEGAHDNAQAFSANARSSGTVTFTEPT